MTGRFYNPTDIRWSCWQDVGQLLPAPPLRVLIITGSSSQTRAVQLQEKELPGHSVSILPNIPADPTTDSVQTVIDGVKTKSPDWIIALGGGSVLDTAKIAAVLARNNGPLPAYLKGDLKVEVPGIPLIAVPTTSGSGSEVTPYASVTDSREMRKISLTHDYLYPKFALLDPSLTTTLPKRQTVVSGMDALSHSIEGYWSKQSSPVTDAYALAASKLMLSSLPTAYHSGEDLDARRLVMEGSLLAGLAISNARTTAVHAVSYPMTVFFHVPHGQACGILLSPFIRYNSGAMERKKEAQFLENLGVASMDDLADAVEHLQEQLDLPIRLSELGLKGENIPTIVENGYRPDRMGNNPRPITAEELTALLETIL